MAHHVTRIVRIGTRGSALALWQANAVKTLLERRWPAHHFTIIPITPEGDLDKHSDLTTIGGRGVFTSALQRQLLDGRIDLAVHSTKDLPSLPPVGLTVAAYPQREDARDAIVSRHDRPFEDLPPNPVIGTSSRRRAAQVHSIRPDAVIRSLRGNIDTRLARGRTDEYDAIILAAAGLHRMGWDAEITRLLPPDEFCPAPGQGALAIETRSAPDPAFELVTALDDPDIRLAVTVERAFLRGVSGGCSTPLGAHAEVELLHGQRHVRFWGMLASDDERRMRRIYREFDAATAESEAFVIAQALLAKVQPRWHGEDRWDPLAERRIVLTGTSSSTTMLADVLTRHGALVHRIPLITTRPVDDAMSLLGAVCTDADWLTLTSPNAVPAVIDVLPQLAPIPQIGVVGEQTASALLRYHLTPTVIAKGPGAAQLADDLIRRGVKGAKIVCVQSNRARPLLTDRLREAGANVVPIVGYETTPVSSMPDHQRSFLASGAVDAITFASPSAVTAFLNVVGPDLPAVSGAGMVALGPTTAAAMVECGLPVHSIAHVPSPAGMIDALTCALGGRGSVNPGGPPPHD